MLQVQLTVFDAAQVKLKNKPYEVAWHVATATSEQLETGARLCEAMARSFRKESERRGDPDNADQEVQPRAIARDTARLNFDAARCSPEDGGGMDP